MQTSPVTKTSAAGPVLAGNDITYTITVLNTGPSDAQTVALTDPLPADTTFVSDTQTAGLPFTLTGPAVGGTGTISDTIATLAVGRLGDLHGGSPGVAQHAEPDDDHQHGDSDLHHQHQQRFRS